MDTTDNHRENRGKRGQGLSREPSLGARDPEMC